MGENLQPQAASGYKCYTEQAADACLSYGVHIPHDWLLWDCI